MRATGPAKRPDAVCAAITDGMPPATGSGTRVLRSNRLHPSRACPLSPRTPPPAATQALWPKLPNLKWMHSASAGLEHLLFPALVDGPVVLTNAKGVYSHSLAEYCLTACNWFAKDVPRLMRQQVG